MPYERACQPTKCTCIENNTYINKDDDDDEDQSDSDSDDDDDDDDDNELHYITKKNDKEITKERKPVWEDEADDEERYCGSMLNNNGNNC